MPHSTPPQGPPTAQPARTTLAGGPAWNSGNSRIFHTPGRRSDRSAPARRCPAASPQLRSRGLGTGAAPLSGTTLCEERARKWQRGWRRRSRRERQVSAQTHPQADICTRVKCSAPCPGVHSLSSSSSKRRKRYASQVRRPGSAGGQPLRMSCSRGRSFPSRPSLPVAPGTQSHRFRKSGRWPTTRPIPKYEATGLPCQQTPPGFGQARSTDPAAVS